MRRPLRPAICRWQDCCASRLEASLAASLARGPNCYTSNGICLGCVARVAYFVDHFSERTAILELLYTRKLAELAANLAQDVAKRYPPAIANNPVQMVSQQRLSEILDEVFAHAADFSRENKLGWYKRARLGRRFRWELKEMGYDDKFVGTAAKGLILCVSRNPSTKR